METDHWLERLLSFKRPSLSVDVCVGNYDVPEISEYLGN